MTTENKIRLVARYDIMVTAAEIISGAKRGTTSINAE